MRVGELRTIIADASDTDELAIVFFDKEEAEMHAEKEITNGQWSRIVNKWTTNKTLNQVADETFSETVWAITGERDSNEN